MKPIIGITVESISDPENPRTQGRLTLNWNYAQAIADSGGIPILIPPMADMQAIAQLIDGWLIPGGFDINASRFGEENHPKVELQDPSRYEGEYALFEHIGQDMPVFGICYGCQFINVARGGSLIQHLPDEVGSEQHAGGTLQHYKVAQSNLSNAAGTSVIEGKSFHHQAVKDLGASLRVVARSEDGVVEAIEATDRPWMIGVQWHPERTPEDPATIRLFKSFVEAAARHAERKNLVATR